MLLEVNDNGIYCRQADVYIDPWRPVRRAVISHGHADHMRWGNSYYLCHTDTVPALKTRIGVDTNFEALPYGKVKLINGVSFSFHPAGHILGSSQVRVEYKGEIWVFTGDYKIYNDGLSAEYEPVKCHHFISESTFGLPIYQFESPLKIFQDIKDWWHLNASGGHNTVVLCYSLGKAQSILNQFKDSDGPIFTHGAVANLNAAYAENGYHFSGQRLTQDTDKASIKGALIIAPPSTLGTAWMRKFGSYKVAMCSGWMQLRGARRRRGVDKGFIFSDHCDFASLDKAVLATGAENIYITHGYESQYSKWLSERYGLNAHVMKTLYNDEELDAE